jgi:hypothetical protein
MCQQEQTDVPDSSADGWTDKVPDGWMDVEVSGATYGKAAGAVDMEAAGQVKAPRVGVPLTEITELSNVQTSWNHNSISSSRIVLLPGSKNHTDDFNVVIT